MTVEEFLERFVVGDQILALDTISFLKNLRLIEIKSWKISASPFGDNMSFRLVVWVKLHELFEQKVENGIIFKIMDYLHKENRSSIAGPRMLAQEVNQKLIERPSEREVNKEKMAYWIRLMENLGSLLPFYESHERKRVMFLLEYSPDLILETLKLLPKQKHSFTAVLDWLKGFVPCRKRDMEPSIGIWKTILSLHSLGLIRCSYEADKGTDYSIRELGRINCIEVVDTSV
jgi:hypothetical protein